MNNSLTGNGARKKRKNNGTRANHEVFFVRAFAGASTGNIEDVFSARGFNLPTDRAERGTLSRAPKALGIERCGRQGRALRAKPAANTRLSRSFRGQDMACRDVSIRRRKLDCKDRDVAVTAGETALMRGGAVVAQQAHNLKVAGSIPALATPEFVDGQILKTREICGAVPQAHPGDKESGMTGWKVQLENPTGAGKSGCQKGRSPSSSMEQRVKNGRVAPAFTGRFYDTAARLDDVR